MSEKIDKIVAEVETMTVLELNDLVKAIEEKFGVTAAEPVAMVAAPVAGGADGGGEHEGDCIWGVVAADRRRCGGGTG